MITAKILSNNKTAPLQVLVTYLQHPQWLTKDLTTLPALNDIGGYGYLGIYYHDDEYQLQVVDPDQGVPLRFYCVLKFNSREFNQYEATVKEKLIREKYQRYLSNAFNAFNEFNDHLKQFISKNQKASPQFLSHQISNLMTNSDHLQWLLSRHYLDVNDLLIPPLDPTIKLTVMIDQIQHKIYRPILSYNEIVYCSYLVDQLPEPFRESIRNSLYDHDVNLAQDLHTIVVPEYHKVVRRLALK